MKRVAIGFVLALCTTIFAAHPPTGESHGSSHEVPAEAQLELPYAHPTLPPQARWAGAVVLVVLGMFAAALGVGVVVDLHGPEPVPPAHSHDEPPGASHHHGASGTAHHH